MNIINNKRIILTGGGTAGSVTPLLAMAERMERHDASVEFFWLGTETGPEKAMVEHAGIDFQAIASGKLRRYFSVNNFIDVINIVRGFFQALIMIRRHKPTLIMSAGSFVSVPVIWAAWVLRVRTWIHQQDSRPGLANKLMAPFAKIITVTFEKSLADYGKKAVCIGNPIRYEFKENKIDKRTAMQKLGLRSDKPILLVMGGGTGAMAINSLVRDSIPDLTKFCQIIHLTGKDKDLDFAQISAQNPDYKNFEFLNTEGMIKVYTVADAVVSRCGMATLTELCFFQKPSILIPMPDSHQEDNAKIFSEQAAAIILGQANLTSLALTASVQNLFKDLALRSSLGQKIKNVIKTDDGDFLKVVGDMNLVQK